MKDLTVMDVIEAILGSIVFIIGFVFLMFFDLFLGV